MSFVERVVGHVRTVKQIADGPARDKRVVIDYGRHRMRMLELLERFEERMPADGDRDRIIERLEAWRTGRLEWFVEELHWRVLAGPGADSTLEERADLVDFAMAENLGLAFGPLHPPPWSSFTREAWLAGTIGDLWELERDWLSPLLSTTWPRLSRYCAELGLVREEDGTWQVTQAGEMLLRLRGKDVAKWLLTLETQQALGGEDAWRISIELLTELLGERDSLDSEVTWADSRANASWLHMERLAAMGLGDLLLDPEGGRNGWQLTEDGAAVLREVVEGADGPFGLLARAIHQDELSAIVASKHRTAAKAGDHVDATILHARMVAHEVRNALGPVQHASRELRSVLRGEPAPAEVVARLDAIDQGISRLHRFVTESVRLLPPEPQRLAPFSVLEAVAEARKELAPDGIASLTIETLPVSADPRCYGNRGQFVMAMLNVLRNAQQAAGHDVQLAIRVDARDHQKLVLSIEDDGPGVPDAVREHIFENGVSYREDGTGHGLASLRAVVEDMGGKVRCSTSELGGAKFEIVLPLAEDPS